MYNVKYLAEFTNANNVNCQLKILQDNADTTVEYVTLGSEPVLQQAAPNSGIAATSLSFSLQSDTDSQFTDLYTTANKRYRVELYAGTALIWMGYLLTELYEEDYIAPPYDVALSATDLLGWLKNQTFVPKGERRSLLSIIDECIKLTGLVAEYRVYSDIAVFSDENTAVDESHFAYLMVNDAMFVNKNCYEVLQMVLNDTSSFITQRNGVWWIITTSTSPDRGRLFAYSKNTLERIPNEEVILLPNLGQPYTDELWPIGSMKLSKNPAMKSMKVTTIAYISDYIFKNPHMVNSESWSIKESTVIAPQVKIINGIEHALNYFLLRRIYIDKEGKSPVPSIYQSTVLNKTSGVELVLRFKTLASATEWSLNGRCKGNVRVSDCTFLRIKMHLETWDGKIYYLSPKEGWTEEVSYIPVRIPFSPFYEAYNKANIPITEIKCPELPSEGILTLEFCHGGKLDQFFQVISYAEIYEDILVTDVTLTPEATSIVTPEFMTLFESDASKNAPELKLSLIDSSVGGPADAKYYLNLISAPFGVSQWSIGGISVANYLLLSAYAHSRRYSSVKRNLEGTVSCGKLFMYCRDAFTGAVLELVSYTYKLSSMEAQVVLKEPGVAGEHVAFGTMSGDVQQSTSSSSTGEGNIDQSNTFAPTIHDHEGQLLRPSELIIPSRSSKLANSIYMGVGNYGSRARAGVVVDMHQLQNTDYINSIKDMIRQDATLGVLPVLKYDNIMRPAISYEERGSSIDIAVLISASKLEVITINAITGEASRS